MTVFDQRPDSMWTLAWCVHQALEVPRVAWSVGKSQWAPRSRRVAYIGWLGHENLGDQAIYSAIRHVLGPTHLRHFAGVRKERFLARMLSWQRLYSFGVLGGGTLILGGYLDSVETLLGAGVEVRCFGTGVEEFDATAATECEFRNRWAAALRRMGTLHVRGPRSKELLSKIGVHNVVVSGDAALLLALPTIPNELPEKVLGVCLTMPTTYARRDNEELCDNIVAACRLAQSENWRIKVFAVARGDKSCCQELARRLQLGESSVQVVYDDGNEYIQEVQKCTAFLGVRLHSVVLAHCAYVPSVMIAYAPKCADHMAAVGMEDFSLPPHQWKSEIIFSKIQQAYVDRRRIREELFDRCSACRAKLNEIAVDLRQHILGIEAANSV